MDPGRKREVERELVSLLNVQRREGEPRARYLRRMANKLSSKERVYLGNLSDEAYDWALAALEAQDDGESIPDFDEVDQSSLMDSLLTVLEAEDEVQDSRLSFRSSRQDVVTSGKVSKTDAELRQAQKDALVAFVLRHPGLGEHRLVEALARSGLRVSLRHARQAVGQVTTVMRAITSQGWQVIDEHGDRVLV